MLENNDIIGVVGLYGEPGPSVLGKNQILAKHLSLTSNSFDLLGGEAGTVIADSAIFMGNQASGKTQLLNVSRENQKAANLIKITDM